MYDLGIRRVSSKTSIEFRPVVENGEVTGVLKTSRSIDHPSGTWGRFTDSLYDKEGKLVSIERGSVSPGDHSYPTVRIDKNGKYYADKNMAATEIKDSNGLSKYFTWSNNEKGEIISQSVTKNQFKEIIAKILGQGNKV